jgi:GT2 family glycosyltransferase
MNKVSIITVNFNHSHVTDDLLASIIQFNSIENIEVIVVDNGSEVDPIPGWKFKYPHFIFIRSDKNLGFAGGNNLGVKASSGDLLFFVNNDTIFTENLVEQLSSTLLHNPHIGIVSPKILYYDKPTMIQYVGYSTMNYYTARNKCLGQYKTDLGQYNNEKKSTAFAHGAAMMIKRSVIEKAGMMFEGYFLYYEELDWCEQIKRAGYEVWVDLSAAIFHKESISVGKKTALKEYFMNRNRILFIRRNAPLHKRLVFYCYFIFFVVFRNCAEYLIKGNYRFIVQLFRAIWWNITQHTNSLFLGFKHS